MPDGLRRTDGSWNPAHGTWYGKAELAPAPGGSGSPCGSAVSPRRQRWTNWFDEALRLL